jgi:hypothetical protein
MVRGDHHFLLPIDDSALEKSQNGYKILEKILEKIQ